MVDDLEKEEIRVNMSVRINVARCKAVMPAQANLCVNFSTEESLVFCGEKNWVPGEIQETVRIAERTALSYPFCQRNTFRQVEMDADAIVKTVLVRQLAGSSNPGMFAMTVAFVIIPGSCIRRLLYSLSSSIRNRRH